MSAKYNEDFIRFNGKFWRSAAKPPWYTLGSLTVISGNEAVELDLPTGKLETSQIEAWGDACAAPEPEKVRSFLMEHLRANGYQVP